MQETLADFRAMKVDPQMRPEHHRQPETAVPATIILPGPSQTV
jgi:hypothetical protein